MLNIPNAHHTVSIHMDGQRIQDGKCFIDVKVRDTKPLPPFIKDRNIIHFCMDAYQLREYLNKVIEEQEARQKRIDAGEEIRDT